MVLHRSGERAMWSVYSLSSYPSNVVCVGLCHAGGSVLQPQPHVLWFSQCCLIHEQLLAVFLVRGSKARNNLCHHRGDITPNLHFYLMFSLTNILCNKHIKFCIICYIMCSIEMLIYVHYIEKNLSKQANIQYITVAGSTPICPSISCPDNETTLCDC